MITTSKETIVITLTMQNRSCCWLFTSDDESRVVLADGEEYINANYITVSGTDNLTFVHRNQNDNNKE